MLRPGAGNDGCSGPQHISSYSVCTALYSVKKEINNATTIDMLFFAGNVCKMDTRCNLLASPHLSCTQEMRFSCCRKTQ
ncbi:hypothetical protein SERLA73DRAFT_137023 [Serpula lacrymans var. lacrymans S7.3]|uniref:Uncharacterized protein n=1 Tax=Serpula lacrymans var. lacrymans (strain S7.3) TaxID=936435 RepID=F8PYJ8_SERL3|nr:hypothetical protein SERLA73DRAFT_137023 [Serpula lacrymans var. lacrymans S7.3]